MKVLGIRCSNKDFNFVVLSGNKKSPKIKEKNRVSFPKGFSRVKELKWFLQEIEDLLVKHNIKQIGIKAPEAMASRNKPLDARIENEAIILLAAGINGKIPAYKKTKSTIAKDLVSKGKAKYLSTKLDCSVIQGFDTFSDNMKEAILAAWSLLK